MANANRDDNHVVVKLGSNADNTAVLLENTINPVTGYLRVWIRRRDPVITLATNVRRDANHVTAGVAQKTSAREAQAMQQVPGNYRGLLVNLP